MKKAVLIFVFLISSQLIKGQLPSNVLVGYLENWNTLKLSQIHPNYNVICLAFALPVNYPTPGYDMRFALPAGYSTAAQLMADIDLMHSQGKVVLLSIGGATGPIKLNNDTEKNIFISSMNAIFSAYSYKIDGIDMDLETSGSMGFGSSWTISSPATAQLNMVAAIQSIMANYQSVTGKKMLLTMAPEVIYLLGGLSSWQVNNVNGGAFLPILDRLRNELDLLHMQLYNAGGAFGGVYAWNGTLYYDNGTADFMLAMNESIIKGFTCVEGKGTFNGIPASKLAFGLPATSAASTAGTGYVPPATICQAVKYFKGLISKPAGVTYTMTASYPALRGLMTWSINEDYNSINGQWNFASNYTCGFPTSLPVELIRFEANLNSEYAELSWLVSSDSKYNKVYIEVLENGVSRTVGVAYYDQTYYKIPVSELTTGINYFRLVFEESENEFHYSDVKQLNYTIPSVKIYLNDSKLIAETNNAGLVEIRDVQGRLILLQEIQEGKNEISSPMLSNSVVLIQFVGKQHSVVYSTKLFLP